MAMATLFQVITTLFIISLWSPSTLTPFSLPVCRIWQQYQELRRTEDGKESSSLNSRSALCEVTVLLGLRFLRGRHWGLCSIACRVCADSRLLPFLRLSRITVCLLCSQVSRWWWKHHMATIRPNKMTSDEEGAGLGPIFLWDLASSPICPH